MVCVPRRPPHPGDEGTSADGHTARKGSHMRRSVITRQSAGPVARGGFSLIELVIVVVIIGIIAAIAIPRLSRGSAGAADSALSGNLAVLRNAVDLYATEHGGTFPKLAQFSNQLTQYTDAA